MWRLRISCSPNWGGGVQPSCLPLACCTGLALPACWVIWVWQGQFLVSLIAFNIGVEIGQLACILIAFAVIVIAVWAAGKARLNDEEAMVAEMPVMYRSVSIVGSLVIAAIGLYWFVERALL